MDKVKWDRYSDKLDLSEIETLMNESFNLVCFSSDGKYLKLFQKIKNKDYQSIISSKNDVLRLYKTMNAFNRTVITMCRQELWRLDNHGYMLDRRRYEELTAKAERFETHAMDLDLLLEDLLKTRNEKGRS